MQHTLQEGAGLWVIKGQTRAAEKARHRRQVSTAKGQIIRRASHMRLMTCRVWPCWGWEPHLLWQLGCTAIPAALTSAWLNASCRTFYEPYQLINAQFANAQARGILHQRSCRVSSSCQNLLRTSLKSQLSSNSGKSAPSRFHQGLWEQKVCFSFREQLSPSSRKASLVPKRIVFSYKGSLKKFQM